MLKSTSYLKTFKAIALVSLLFSAVEKGYSKEDEVLKNPQDTSAILLNEVVVLSGVKNKNFSPLRLVNISESEIAMNSAGKTYPELLKSIPGVFATSETGSYADAKINIRGYKQENISVMLNGIPISGLTSGSMFWNNWAGLTDATSTIQLQKGVGASMLSDNSVGGTINIITHSPKKTPSIGLGYYYASSGISKGYINYNSGELKKGWGIVLMGSYTGGSSWVEQTNVNSWAYMASISKKINKQNSLLFTAMGSPEKHEQRSNRLSYKEMEQYGRDYNKNWGYYFNPDNSRTAKTLNKNNYFKPYFTLNHIYTSKIGANSKKFTLNNALYFATGNGGGYWSESKGKRIISYLKDGHIDWNSVVEANKAVAKPISVGTEEGSAQNILSDYMAGNTQVGAKSSFELELNKRLNLLGGIHYQHYRTWEKEQITDLLGGNYWYEDYSKSIAGIAGRNPVKVIGDYIRTNNGRIMHFSTVFMGLNYKNDRFIAELGTSLNYSSTKRWDKYNYVKDIYSKAANRAGGSVKGGILYKIRDNDFGHNFYLNGAYYNRVPYANVFFANGNNQITHDVKNETNYLGEAGYRLIFPRGGFETTFYASYWKNKSMMSNPYKPLEEEAFRYMITGLDAFHCGVEIDAFYNFTDWLKLYSYASFGNWKWKNNVSATIYDNYTMQVDQQINVYSNGLPVGDAPQTQIGANLTITPIKNYNNNLNFIFDWQFNDRYWADFEPSSRQDIADKALPYRIPAYHIANFSANYTKKVKFNNNYSASFSLFANVRNIFDTFYIERGKDGFDHSINSFTGYWGEGRNFNLGIRVIL